MKYKIGNKSIDYFINTNNDNQIDFKIENCDVRCKGDCLEIDDEVINSGTILPIIKGNSIKDYKTYFQCNKFFKLDQFNYSSLEFTRNKTYKFFNTFFNLPLNSYILNIYLDESLKYIYFVYRFYNLNYYIKSCDIIIKHPQFKEKFFNEERGLDIYQFYLKDEYLEDLKLFLAGKYHFMNALKGDIIKSRKKAKYNETDVVQQIIMNNPGLRQELSYLYNNNLQIPDYIGLDSKPLIDEEIWQKQVNLN